MKRFKLLAATLAVALFGSLVFAPVASVGALDPLGNICVDNPNSEVCKSKDDSATDIIGVVINTLLFIVGTLSVIMIIVGGIFYATSAGDSSKVTKAKNTLTYAIVGLVVAFLAYAIINWVVQLF